MITVFGVTFARMCGGACAPWRGGNFARRVTGGVVFDWIGVGVWREQRRKG